MHWVPITRAAESESESPESDVFGGEESESELESNISKIEETESESDF